jgi:hypothetical protein
MSDSTNCARCGVSILSTTAARNGGLCVPCSNGTREHIEESKRRAIEERELERTDPIQIYWRALEARVDAADSGLPDLSDAERQYYAVNCLEDEVYNGGFDQFFFNSSGALYEHAERGLEAIGALHSLALLRTAKDILFRAKPVPTDTAKRRTHLRLKAVQGRIGRLEPLDDQFWKDPDVLGPRLRQFATEHKLIA